MRSHLHRRLHRAAAWSCCLVNCLAGGCGEYSAPRSPAVPIQQPAPDDSPSEADPPAAAAAPNLIRPDDRKAVKALRERQASFYRNPAGNVISVTLPEDATDDDLALLLKLHMLRAVNLNQAKATAQAIGGLAEIAQLRSMHADRTRLDDATLARFARTPLEEISLSGAPISDAGVRRMADWKHLQRLDVSWTAVTNEAIDSLTRLETLEELNLGFTGVNDQAIESLGRIRGLKRVVLEGADISEAGARRLQQLLPQAQIVHSALAPEPPPRPAPQPQQPKGVET